MRAIGVAATGLSLLLAGRAMPRRRYQLAGRTAIVTGGSRGLGLLVSQELLRHGARVALCARDAAELERAASWLRQRVDGARVIGLPCDVSDPAAVQATVSEVRARFGPIDVLVNDAGVIQVGPEELMTLGDHALAHDVMFWGVLHTSRAVLPAMQERGTGRIVNITSIAASVPVPHLLPYVSAKFAAVGFSQGLAAEVRRSGVRVTTVVPGLMRTGSYQAAQFKGRREQELTWFALGASLPGVSMDAERAARRIVRACIRGDPYVVLGLPARVARLAAAIFPGFTVRAMGVVSRALPKPEDTGPALPGKDIEASIKHSWLTGPNRRAAQRLNEPGTLH